MAITNQSSASESPVKHTSAGEMPDTSVEGRTLERAQADAAVLGEARSIPRWVWAVGGLLGIGAVSFFVLRNRREISVED